MILKDIKGYEGIYKASDDGRIWSSFTHSFLKGSPDKDGYLRVILYHGGKDSAKTRKMYHIHKLIALTFLENKDNLPVINHKDENKQNNSVNNLEWCTIRYNDIYNGLAKRRVNKQKKLVYGYNGTNIKKFASLTEAEDYTGASLADISMICNYGSNNRKSLSSTKGWTFSYTKEFPKTSFKRNYVWYTYDGSVYHIYPNRSFLERETHTNHATFMKFVNTGIKLRKKDFCIGREPV